jgi:nitrate/TMAO reductase-like tetraheme cytochrome c subunit
MEQNQDIPEAENNGLAGKKSRKQNLTIAGMAALFLIIAGLAFSGYAIHQSNTNAEFCASCHIMERNVTSYLSSNHLDNIHAQANVACKECHDYPLSAEISSGIKYVLGDYSVDADGELQAVQYSNDICLKCHINYSHLAESTDFLAKNPHDSHNGQIACKTCHVSHGEQIDYCSDCHDNGGQRMVEEDTPRETKIQ